MPTSPQLSSSWTFPNKWALPAFFLLGWPLLVQSALRGTSEMWIGAMTWGAACVVFLFWSWPIKLVTVEGDHFIISNYVTSHRAPIAHLVSIAENYNNRTPTITLYFEPPTPFGKRVRIIPPQGLFMFNREGYDEVAAFLRSLINDRERL